MSKDVLNLNMTAAEYVKYLADNHVKIELPEDNRKYPMQQCQDKDTNDSFRQLHFDVVNMIIRWCKDHNIIIDEFHLNADGIRESIPYGEWQPCTDSSLTFYDMEHKGDSKYHTEPILFSM